jgi:hypothetical protein
MTDDPKFKGIEIDGRRYVLLGCFQCPFWHDEGTFLKCEYPHKPSECLERSEWSYPDDCPLEDAKKREATDKRWAVIKTLEYSTPGGSSENIKKGVNELTLKILTTDNLAPQIKDFMDRKEGSTLRLLDTLSRIAIEPKIEEVKE